jgi:hypothetical protein
MSQLPRLHSIEVTAPPQLLYALFFQSQDEIFFKGRAVTPHVMETLMKVTNK